MASFGWKRKINSVSKNNLFTNDDDTNTRQKPFPFKRMKTPNVTEDVMSKCLRLKNEGTILADSERHWEAIKKWDEAVKLNPTDEKLHEMMAQVYLLLNELLPAVKCAKKCVKTNPKWWIGYQTYGRTLLGIGEVKMAIRSFSKALHIQPDVIELREDDINWACTLLKQHNEMTTTKCRENADLIDIDEDNECKQVAKWTPDGNPVTEID
uniref:Uncharacterized protein n=1 Tax=Strigamia maritima TaxID=126957 RepID=T1JIH8_STRMM